MLRSARSEVVAQRRAGVEAEILEKEGG